MKIIGHRGAAALAPENTLAAVQAGIDAGADMVEIDVRTTADGQVVLCHDKSLARAGQKPLLISSTSLADLRLAKPDLPTLDELLAAFPTTTIMIEIKAGAVLPPVMTAVQKSLVRGRSPSTIWLGSKRFAILKAVRKQFPDLTLIVIEPWSGVRGSHRARALHANKLAMNRRWLWSGFIRTMTRNYELYAYTVNNPAKARQWGQAGLTGVFTDNPKLYHEPEA
jgi:glycerophosphoryl diester phosphodiesterase